MTIRPVEDGRDASQHASACSVSLVTFSEASLSVTNVTVSSTRDERC